MAQKIDQEARAAAERVAREVLDGCGGVLRELAIPELVFLGHVIENALLAFAAERERALVAAVEPYMRHDFCCGLHQGPNLDYTFLPCDCGLDAALQGRGGAARSAPQADQGVTT